MQRWGLLPGSRSSGCKRVWLGAPAQEKQELEEQRLALVEEVQSYRQRIAQLEADLLFRLSNSQARPPPGCHCMAGRLWSLAAALPRDLLAVLSCDTSISLPAEAHDSVLPCISAAEHPGGVHVWMPIALSWQVFGLPITFHEKACGARRATCWTTASWWACWR